MSTKSRNTAKGRLRGADKAGLTLPDAVPVEAKGQMMIADKAVWSVPDASPNAAKGLMKYGHKATATLPDAATLDALAELQVRRKFYIGVVNKQTNAAKALARRSLGWRYDEEETSREKTNARAARIVATALSGKEQKPEDMETFGALAFDLASISAAIDPCAKARHGVELEMKRIVRKLPAYQWAKNVHGLGELGLAVIIAEAGNLSNYPKKGHLWKRLGLAPFEGRAMSTWRMKGGLTAADWSELGYSPRRRAEIYAVVSEPLFRAQSVAQGPYRAVYDRRRAANETEHPDWTKAHSHMDGLRVMTKIMLRDLWNAWNGREVEIHLPTRPSMRCPPSALIKAA